MRFSLIYVSDKPSQWAEQAYTNYAKRIPAQFKFAACRISPNKRNKTCSMEAMRDEEWSRINEKLNKGALLVLLDERGEKLDSKAFAGKINVWQEASKDVDFIIAGADGVNASVRENVDFMLSLSSFTFPHELARVVLIEQLYRAWTILNNHPYHRV